MTTRPTGGYKNPNPQGKGLVPVLQDLQGLPLALAGRKSPIAFFRDYCVSALVLSAHFRFMPVAEKPYYLYSTDDGWTLSLVAPEEWGSRPPGEFVAGCTLRADMTWDVRFRERPGSEGVTEKLERHVEGFINAMERDSIEEALPFYVGALPYYQRVLATAMAGSLSFSMPPEKELKQLAGSISASRLLLSDSDPQGH